MFKVICTAALILTPTLIRADGIGTVDATFDGEARTYHTISVKHGEDTAATATYNNTSRLSSLSIQAHPAPRFTSTDVLSISIDWIGEIDAAKSPMSVEVLYLPQGMSKPFYTTDQMPEAPKITFDSLDISASPGHATGTVEATLCLVPKLYEAPDPTDCMQITAGFDTAIYAR
ncbi:hypothetical protein ATO6_03750 [Oceanicola sp. 22II-s10i]|uniref:hypothetical protein n=1 Tax=Oceanicola sp. 22II-s10i TaxID=1317116 RepID=UPI000B5257EA|nr:hypothetical protein [Oceanicola sp. 22II-s10i]OWU85995.1 hypothetical protein ATO6_03750 [Oceanicola sp. 22II-s10i]